MPSDDKGGMELVAAGTACGSAVHTCMASSRVGSRMSANGCSLCALLHTLDEGDEEAEGFAGSGLRGREHIAAFERGRNGLGLNGRRGNEICTDQLLFEVG